MKIAVVTESSADLKAQAVKDYQITVVNDPIMFGNHVYHENVDITTDQFYRLLKVEKEIPTISQISQRCKSFLISCKRRAMTKF